MDAKKLGQFIADRIEATAGILIYRKKREKLKIFTPSEKNSLLKRHSE